LSYSAESAVIQQCFLLTTNQRTVLSATINQRNEQAACQYGYPYLYSYSIFNKKIWILCDCIRICFL
jgi:hypothetical protein